jgi:hypothetical protein
MPATITGRDSTALYSAMRGPMAACRSIGFLSDAYRHFFQTPLVAAA